MIFLTEDEDATNYAYRLNSPDDVPKPNEQETKQKDRRERKEDKEDAIAMAELDEKLKIIQERMNGPKVKKPGEQRRETCEKDYDSIMGVSEYCRQKTAEVMELYKNDPVRLAEALAAIQFIREKYA